MPANLITLAHFPISVSMNLPNSAGVIGFGFSPKAAKARLDPRDQRRSAFTSLLSFSMISMDVFLGAAYAVPAARYVARHKFSDRGDIRQRIRARRSADCQGPAAGRL